MTPVVVDPFATEQEAREVAGGGRVVAVSPPQDPPQDPGQRPTTLAGRAPTR